MVDPKQYRDKAAQCSERRKTANGPDEARALEQLEKSLAVLADNEQWLADNRHKTVKPQSA